MHEITCHAVEPVDFRTVRRIEGFDAIKAEFPAYLTDESKLSCRPFDHLFFPRTEAELAAVLKEMGRRRVKVTVAGARTGLGKVYEAQGRLDLAEEIFREAGYGVSSIMFNIVITGIVMLFFTLIAIQTVDHFGRRILMLTGCAGIGIFHTLVGLCSILHFKGLIVVVPVMATIACYSFSLAPVTWVLISEIFPNRIRGAAVAVAVSALWIACFILTYTFPLLNRALGPAMTFWLYAAICAAGFAFIYLQVPETKNKSLEQIEKELVD